MKEKSIFSKDYRRIVDRIKKERILSGLSQNELAKRLKKTQSYISKIESAQTRIDVIQMKEISKVLGKNLDYFLN